ncbi:beta-ketoacyl-ACP synthase 3 [Streptomyces monticola]|uniref:Beta-ketoacyl-ACP synthase 3 n=1 Tax=Streptomyces monticola TaxID=2666263 RepID=A0ABW2JXE0_9ACTN
MSATALGAPATGSRITAVAHHLPGPPVSNGEVAARAGVAEDWIRRRVGIEARHHARAEESVVDLAEVAAAKALAAAGCSPDEIGLVILATCSMESPMPTGAARLAARLGLDHCGAFDLNAACAGFGCALAVADQAVRSGAAAHVLVVGAEKMTAWVDAGCRATAPIFADGAGAVVVSAGTYRGIGPVVWGHRGEDAELIAIPDRAGTVEMRGQEVYRWATTDLGALLRSACDQAGVAPEDLAAFVPHQANARIIAHLVRQLELTPDTVVSTDITHSGNTSAASVPIALSKLVQRGTVPSRAPVLLFGFGAGLTWAGQVVLCP